MNQTPTAAAFHWEKLETDHPMPEIARQRVIGQHVMISRVLLEKGCHVPTHAHENEQMTCLVSGKLKFRVGEADATAREITVGPGEVMVLPPNVPHAADALEDTVVLDVFSPPSAGTGLDAHAGD